MTTNREISGRAAAIAFAVLVAFGCGESRWDEEETTSLSEAIVSCEEAYARLVECCPGFRNDKLGENEGWGALCHDFSYEKSNSYGCDGNTSSWDGHIKPALDAHESACIRETSCDELQTRRVCVRARAAKARGREVFSPGTDGHGPPTNEDYDARPAVCP